MPRSKEIKYLAGFFASVDAVDDVKNARCKEIKYLERFFASVKKSDHGNHKK